MSLSTVAAAIAGGLATAAYLDAKFLIRHDLAAGSLGAGQKKAVAFTVERYQQNRMLMYHVFEDQATGRNADQLFLMFEGRSWTYKQFFTEIHKVANWLRNDLGVRAQEIVALDGGNSPEFLMLWFGLEAIRACPAFINCNLTAGPLTHSVKLSDARYLLADRAATTDLVRPCEDELRSAGVTTVYYDEAFLSALTDTTPVPKALHKGISPTELAGLIYTSGTTGLPKGVIMLRGRELNTARSVAEYLKLKPGNRMYTCLPLYHGAAHGLCVTPSIFAGSAVVLSRKFSHKTLWPEVRASQADILQYVGELCRYLINAPPSPLDKQHHVKMAWGNGMRPDVWETFRQRFGIETINELYAATDGMGATFNANRGDFGRNAVGVRGLYWHWANGANEKRVRIDIDTEEILRDDQGFAIECKTGEPGEVVHRMDPATVDTVFAGYYKNKGAGQKRFIRDLFRKGDLWFRSGDMMRQDADGCVYFVDRLGDTFRWRSENVSTNEVSDVLGRFDQIAEANVYGVQVPHADGRAGCAAIVPVSSVTSPEQLDLARLAEYLLSTLPRYAVPIFLRVVPQLEYTGTMKLQKGRLRTEGVDLDKIEKSAPADRMYWLPPNATKYEVFGRKEWEELKAGKVRL
ncbi:Fatty acid transporter protein [Cladophialophora carrionii]|uniref:Very long-chain fatty acid transport protein n=1 Tax=Cladophialophora carrionii TaxID=86049 RepID=A0A1C1CI34_9EURO|nr:Fatty acid transporter protein [Cladophialophora carrionii]